MIGPGTGVVPFIGFIEEMTEDSENQNHLFFGCRDASKDFIFSDII
jgi:sulfite reductase alpha subunit-like flavoprotein